MSNVPEPRDAPQVIETPKSFYKKERQLYTGWTLALWRELFQNSVDARAKRVDVRIEDADRRGSFGMTPEAERVTRITFSDDGHGMSKEVLQKVYFQPGQTTKTDGETVGGFGRARLLTTFSMERYGIQTQGNVVEGDGAKFDIYTPEVARDRFASWAASAEGRSTDDASPDARSARLLRAEVERLAAAPAQLKGCRFEIDVDPAERDGYGVRASVGALREKLSQYLEQSDLPCAVTINGEPVVKRRYKLEGRRDLVATFDADKVDQAWVANPKVDTTLRADGRYDVAFGKLVLVSNKDVRDCGGQLVVRVNGAAMYAKNVYSNSAMFLELNPVIAREVLTANRDTMKSTFQDVVDDFVRLMATDSQAALANKKKSEFNMVRGGLGSHQARRPVRMDASVDLEVVAARGGGGLTSKLMSRIRTEGSSLHFREWDWEDFVSGRAKGLDHGLFKEFFALVGKEPYDRTFLGRFSDQRAARGFYESVRSGNVPRAMVEASGTLLGFVADSLKLVRTDMEFREFESRRDRMSDLHDVPILREDVAPPPEHFTGDELRQRRDRIMSAIRRHDPRGWDPSAGKGKEARKVLACWQVAVDRVVEILMEENPGQKPFEYSSGWVFTHPRHEYSSVTGRTGWVDTDAMARSTEEVEGRVYQFLVNPLDSKREFASRFRPRDLDDRDRLIKLAAHEVSHVMGEGHNDAFSYVHTGIELRLGTREMRSIHRLMDAACDAVDIAYSEGRTKVVPLDAEEGVRPYVRLVRGVEPGTPPSAFETDPDGSYEVDHDLVANDDEDEPERRMMM